MLTGHRGFRGGPIFQVFVDVISDGTYHGTICNEIVDLREDVGGGPHRNYRRGVTGCRN